MSEVDNDKKTGRQLLEGTHDAVIQLKTVLLGVPGTDDKGLVGEVKSVKTEVNTLYSRHRKLNLKVWVLIATLAASGALGASELANLTSIFR